MRTRATIVFAGCLALASAAQAGVIDVTVSVDKDTINIGEMGTLTVYGQLTAGHDTAGNGVFGWGVDLRIADPTIIELLPATFALPPGVWTSNAMTSSPGTPTAWGLDAIHDTGEGADDLGLAGPVELFSVDYRSLSEGVTVLTVEPDTTTGADFVTWLGESGGDYSQASSAITVVPEPATIGLLGFGVVAALCRRKW